MRVLFVKLTSMGDLIHALPAMTDAMQANPTIRFDWVIEKSFSDIATWHPAVKNIIPASHRIWSKNLFLSLKNGEIKQFIQSLRKSNYDVVIDGQASIKSAVLTLLSKGKRHGLDRHSARESIASFAYQKRYFVDKKEHAITRLRMLFSQIFQYDYTESQPNYAIANYPFPSVSFALPKPYIVFIHNASWESKLWPESYWHQLIHFAAREHFNVLLPWGNVAEKNRAEKLAQGHTNAFVLPFCSLSEHAYILKNAIGVISCDTGLSHLSAALNVKNVTIYGPTSSALIGAIGRYQLHQEPLFSCTRCYQYHCRYDKTRHIESLCMLSSKPDMLWSRFKSLL